MLWVTVPPMITLGLHAFTHDSAAALVVDGRLRAFTQEERLSRIKGDGRFPAQAIDFCLRDAKIDPQAVDRVVLSFRPWIGAATRLAYQLRRPRHGLSAAFDLMAKGRGNLGLVQQLRKLGIQASISRADHHEAHARAVFLASPFDSAAVLVVDGVAEAWSGASFVARRRPSPVFECRGRIPFPASLGLVYAAVTEHLGFRHNREEGKIMAMAASGTDDLVVEFGLACRLERGRLIVDHRLFDFGGQWTTKAFEKSFGPRRRPSEGLQPRHFALARALQTVTEGIAVELSRDLIRESGEENLCLTGGLALNPALNGAVVEGSGATDVYLLPVGGDAGTAIGGALAFETDPNWRLADAYWGSFPTSEEIDHALVAAGLEPSVVGAGVVPKTAELLAGGAIGGWFQGRSEMGPRALGHRSILADPTREDSRIRLNKLIKRRETFQPFAPCVLLDACEELFPGMGPSEFMLRTWPVAEESRPRIPAVIHDDGTARVQTVVEGDGSGLAELLQAFAGHTGLPVLLNTSLNRRGEPLAERPDDAVTVFQETDLDFLVMEDVLIERTKGTSNAQYQRSNVEVRAGSRRANSQQPPGLGSPAPTKQRFEERTET